MGETPLRREAIAEWPQDVLTPAGTEKSNGVSAFDLGVGAIKAPESRRPST